MSGSAISSATSTGCVDAETIVLTVATTDAGTAESTGVPYELVIIEEPPVADPAALPPSANEAQREWVLGVPADGAGGPVVAGSSFNDATALTPGSYTSDILTGEHQLFRVPVEWGQELHVQARFETPGPAEAAALPAAPTARIYLYNPTRGPVTDAFSRGDGVGYHESIRTDHPTLLSAAAPEVRWRNREWLLGNDTASLTGDYFVAVSLDPADGGAAFTLPYTLTIENVGTAGAGAPAYEDGAQPTAVTTLGEAAGTTSTGLVVALAGGGSGLIGAGTLGVRRWSRDRPRT